MLQQRTKYGLFALQDITAQVVALEVTFSHDTNIRLGCPATAQF